MKNENEEHRNNANDCNSSCCCRISTKALCRCEITVLCDSLLFFFCFGWKLKGTKYKQIKKKMFKKMRANVMEMFQM